MAVKEITWFSRGNIKPVNNDIKAGGWQDLASGQAGSRIPVAEYADRTVQTHGDYSGSATIQMRGSCMADPDPETPAHWFAVHAAHDGAEILGLSATSGAVILENPLWLSPLVTGGNGSTAINYDITLYKGT